MDFKTALTPVNSMWKTLSTYARAPFPFYLNNDRENLAVVLAISLFTLFFLMIFKPFGLAITHDKPEAPFVFAGIAMAVLMVHVLLLPRLMPRWFDDGCWTLGGFALYNLWIMAVVSVFATIYGHYWLFEDSGYSFLSHLMFELFRVISIGLFPVSAMIFLMYNRMLIRSLRDMNRANQNLGQLKDIAAVRTGAENGSANRDWLIKADTQEQLELSKEAFLYAEADDNYSRIVWLEDGEVQNRLLRLTLKNLEEQLPTGPFSRVHRSFLVNLERVEELRGNASGYRLYLAAADAEIPLARTRSREVLDQIESIGLLT